MLNKKMFKIKNAILYSFILILMCFYFPLYALADDIGSVKIFYHGRTDTGNVILSGAEFTSYYIGSWEDSGIELSEEFKSSGISIDKSDASDRKKQAELLYAYAVDKNIKGTDKITDDSGLLVFDKLHRGIYLIAQKKSLKIGNNTFYSAPFLISVPIREADGFIWNITTEPKSSWTDSDSGGGGGGGGGWVGDGFDPEPDTDESTDSDTTDTEEAERSDKESDGFRIPKTGDESGLYFWGVFLIISAATLILITAALIKSNKKNKTR